PSAHTLAFDMSKPLLSLMGVSKQYTSGDTAINAISNIILTLWRGEFAAIVGRSGSGKSTLMYLLGLLLKPDHGLYVFGGENVAGLSADARAEIRGRRIGFVFQLPTLLPRVDAQENVALPLVYAGVPTAERSRRAKQALESVGLGDRT